MIDEAYRKTAEEVLSLLETDGSGLSEKQVETNRSRYGSNAFGEEKRVSPVLIFLSQFNDFLIWILLVAAILSAVLGKLESTFVIAVVVLLNAVLGTVQHLKAEQSLTALKAMSSPQARVIRGGDVITIDSQNIVVGDIMAVEAGDFIAADGRLISAYSLKADESALTGESLSSEKDNERLEKSNLSPGDQSNMVFSGTHITYGRGLAVVTAVGESTELGKIASLLSQAKEKQTPLQRSLDAFGKKLAIIILAIAAVIFAMNIYRSSPVLDAVMFSVSLAVAAIPEALSSIVTIVLAIGTRRMAQENAIIRRLHAVEGLGSVSVICSDKTGTLTQNKMTVRQAYVGGRLLAEDGLDLEQKLDKHLLNIAMLCNDSITTDVQVIGDPTEVALVDWGEVYKLDELIIRDKYQRISELPFDSERKLMSTLNDIDGQKIMAAKGAVDVMIKRVKYIDDGQGARPIKPDDITRIEKMNAQLSSQGLRVLAFASKEYEGTELSLKDENELTFIGLVAMMDPPRPESRDAVTACHRAGIRTIMITGDHIVTASAIARDIGILTDEYQALKGSEIETLSDKELEEIVPRTAVYARVSPEHKIRIVKAWQQLGHAVAMTGDGVNDAPALKQSDVGVAMGITGTEVSKDAASMVLTDDNFATIVRAVSNGRSIYRNISNAVQFLLSGNTAGILAVLFASLAGLPAPFAPVHLLFINLVTDSLPAIAIGLEKPEEAVMSEPPRNINEPLLNKKFAQTVLFQGLLIGIATMIAFYIGLNADLMEAAVMGASANGAANGSSSMTAATMAFAVLCLARLIHGFNSRTQGPLSLRKLFSNKFSWIAFLSGSLLLAAVMLIRPLQNVFETVNLTMEQYLQIAGLALLPTIIIQIVRRLMARR